MLSSDTLTTTIFGVVGTAIGVTGVYQAAKYAASHAYRKQKQPLRRQHFANTVSGASEHLPVELEAQTTPLMGSEQGSDRVQGSSAEENAAAVSSAEEA